MGITGQFCGIAPGVGRIGAVGRLGAVLEHRLQVAGFVEGQVDRLAYGGLVQRCMLAVDADEGGHEGRRVHALQFGVGGAGPHVLRLGREGDMAFAAAQLLQAHVGVRGDGEHQAIHRRRAGKVLGVGVVAHHRVFLEALEDEGATADRLAVEPLRSAGGEQLVGVFGGVDRGEAHAQGGEEGGVGVAQGKAHSMFAELVDAFDQAGQLHRLGVWVAAGRHPMPGVGRVEHAPEAEQHVVGGQRAAGVEIVGFVEGDILAQDKAVAQAVRADVPALRQAGQQLAAACIELHQAVHQYIGRGIGGGQRVVLHHVEAIRAGFGADAERGRLRQ
ncbi:hypothetical protein D3C84_658080 [compost metagenome]